MRKMVVTVLAMVLTGQPVRADDSIRFLESYAGAHPQEFQELLAQVKSTIPAALAFITQSWRLTNTLHSPIVVVISDTASELPGRPVSAFVRSVRAGDVLRQQLVIDLTHHLMYPGERLDDVLYHEMAHVVLQDGVIGPNAGGIPPWLNEGLAQTVTAEGHDRTVEDYKRYARTAGREVLCDLNGNMDEFYHGEYNFGCYTQFYLAVKRLTARGGPDAVTRLVAGLHAGRSMSALITQLTGDDWPTFQRDVAQYTTDIFNSKAAVP